jgi:hypothetical protein
MASSAKMSLVIHLSATSSLRNKRKQKRRRRRVRRATKIRWLLRKIRKRSLLVRD